MIISYLNGGLGNQVFQYACGRTLADRLGEDCALDLRHFDGNSQFEFSLRHFSIRHVPIDGKSLPPDKKGRPFKYLMWRGLRRKPYLFREDGLGYNSGIEVLETDAYLKGYWQSERYFAANEEKIRDDLQLREPPTGHNTKALLEIGNANAVSLHIRRGDYVSNAAAHATHGTCTLDYYQRAARHIAETAQSDPVIFTFSDDPDWVRENLELPFEMRFVDHNDGSTAHEDIRLMSACRHHIIANSSFSWWGAWLNPSPDKIVVAPKRWFAHPKMHNPDIAPDSWVRM